MGDARISSLCVDLLSERVAWPGSEAHQERDDRGAALMITSCQVSE
jgi:hypothetical protein